MARALAIALTWSWALGIPPLLAHAASPRWNSFNRGEFCFIAKGVERELLIIDIMPAVVSKEICGASLTISPLQSHFNFPASVVRMRVRHNTVGTSNHHKSSRTESMNDSLYVKAMNFAPSDGILKVEESIGLCGHTARIAGLL